MPSTLKIAGGCSAGKYTGNEGLFFCINFFAAPGFSSNESIIKATFCLLTVEYNLAIDGISALQGGHQDAQRLTNTFLPFNDCMVTALPDKSVMLNTGKALAVVVAVSSTVLPLVCNCFAVLCVLLSVLAEQATKVVSKSVADNIKLYLFIKKLIVFEIVISELVCKMSTL